LRHVGSDSIADRRLSRLAEQYRTQRCPVRRRFRLKPAYPWRPWWVGLPTLQCLMLAQPRPIPLSTHSSFADVVRARGLNELRDRAPAGWNVCAVGGRRLGGHPTFRSQQLLSCSERQGGSVREAGGRGQRVNQWPSTPLSGDSVDHRERGSRSLWGHRRLCVLRRSNVRLDGQPPG
jgi:hypothetical protein